MVSNSKIILFTSEFPPLPGGIGNHALNLAFQLSDNKYDVLVVCDQRSNDILDDINYDLKLPFNVIRIKRRKFNLITYLSRINKGFQVLFNNYEVIIASGKFSLWLCGFYSILFRNKKYIAILHGSEIGAGNSASKFLTQWSLKRFDTIVAVSNFTKKIALTFNENLKIEVINNGFTPYDTEIERNKTIQGNPKIVTVGNVTLRKGQQNVIKALPLLKEYFPEIHYHCIGIPTEERFFMELANKLNVQKHITFHGALPTNSVATILKLSDVFFMLSDVLKNGDFEGFGIALLEANSLGLPTIGSKNSGIMDAINDGFSGKLVNPHDPEEVFIALKKVMSDYQNYSKNAILWSENFTWDKIISKYIKIIKD